MRHVARVAVLDIVGQKRSASHAHRVEDWGVLQVPVLHVEGRVVILVPLVRGMLM